MKSRTSCFDRGIAKSLLRRFWPLWGAYFLILTLIPLVLYSRLRRFDPAVDLTPGLDYALGTASTPVLFLSFLMGILTAMAVFAFLYNPRQCALMNSLPVTRSGLFFTSFLTGFLSLLAADLLFLGLTALLCLSGWLSVGMLLRFFAAMLCSKFFFYSFASFCAMLTGSLLILPCVCLVLNFTAIVAETCVWDVLSKVIYGLPAHQLHLSFLSPFAIMMSRLGVEYVKWPYEVTLRGVFTTAIYALVGLGFVVLAWRLFQNRRMETAGDTVAIRVLKPVFQYCMCFGCAVVFADIVYSLIDPKLGGRSAALVMILLLLAGAFLGYFAACMLIEKSFRVFRGHWKGFLVSAMLIVFLVSACEFDVFGVEKFVPAAEKVELAVFDGVELRDRENVERVLSLQRSLIAHKDRHEKPNGPGTEYLTVYEGGMSVSRNVEIRYILHSGRTLTRMYAVRGDERDIADPQSDLMQLESLMNCREALEARCDFSYPLTPENIVTASLEFLQTDEQGRHFYAADNRNLSPDELIDFWENGVLPDLAEGHIARRTVCDRDRGWYYTNAQLYLCLTEDRAEYERSGGSVYKQQWVNVQIATDSVHCLDWIEAHIGYRPTAEDSSYAGNVYGVG